MLMKSQVFPGERGKEWFRPQCSKDTYETSYKTAWDNALSFNYLMGNV